MSCKRLPRGTYSAQDGRPISSFFLLSAKSAESVGAFVDRMQQFGQVSHPLQISPAAPACTRCEDHSVPMMVHIKEVLKKVRVFRLYFRQPYDVVVAGVRESPAKEGKK